MRKIGRVSATTGQTVRFGFARRKTRERALIWFLLFPALSVYFFYRFVPLIWNLVLSFCFWSPGKPLSFAGLYQYQQMAFYDDTFWTALKNTAVFMLVTPIAIILGLALALMVDCKIIGRNFYRAVIFLPYPMMVVAVGIVWRWLYNDRVGLVNYVLRASGLISHPVAFLDSYEFAMLSVMAAALWQIVGLFMIIILAGLQNIPAHLYEAAIIDGARAHNRFFRVTLPLIRPSLFLCIVLGVIASFTSFDLIYTMTGGGPGRATELLITYIYKASFTLNQFGYAAAMTIVMFLVFLFIALISNFLSGGDAGRVDIAD